MTTWYSETTSSESLMQGDLITCPVSRWKDKPTVIKDNPSTTLRAAIQVCEVEAVVMSQSCDLANMKLKNVILCRRYHLQDFKTDWQEVRKSKSANSTQQSLDKEFNDLYRNMTRGYVWNYSVLDAYDSTTIKLQHQIVDFGELLSIPRIFLDDWIKNHEKSRLTLTSPYREHLSQAFARYFMRVGLPAALSSPSP